MRFIFVAAFGGLRSDTLGEMCAEHNDETVDEVTDGATYAPWMEPHGSPVHRSVSFQLEFQACSREKPQGDWFGSRRNTKARNGAEVVGEAHQALEKHDVELLPKLNSEHDEMKGHLRNLDERGDELAAKLHLLGVG